MSNSINSHVFIEQTAELLKSAKRVAILTGAGVSKESGIPTFRDAQTGLWANYRPEDLATPQGFLQNPDLVWQWYDSRRKKLLEVSPNAGHYAMAELAQFVPELTVITQNVDGLHQQAGVALALEPMSRFRTHLVNTPAQALRLVELAAHPHLKISIDTYHAATEVRDLPAAIRAAGSKLWALHACENDRGVPGGGLMPWQEILAAVRETSAEFIEFESYNTSLGDFGWKRGLFQNVCPDGDAFVRQGLEFIRSLMK